MGVLSGFRILEFEAIGPAPFGTMLLADMGADVLRIDRPVAPEDLGLKREGRQVHLTARGRRSVTLDLKDPQSSEVALELMARADAIIEGFRPGTMERLGLGPDVALRRNPKLVYGRMTGWGQTGPPADRAGHDLNYIALVELHDCFAHNELISYEALGLCPVGGAEQFVVDGDNTYGGKVVTNPSGGLLSKGHPLGATGLAQCTELVEQLRGRAGARQVEGARMA